MLGGFLCGGLQALVFVLLKLTIGPTRGAFALLSFFAILGIWLAALSVHHRRPSRRGLLLLAWCALVFCLAVWWAEPNVSQRLMRFGATHLYSAYVAALVSVLLVAGFQLFVPYALWSTLLPALADRVQARGANVSRVYGLNTLSFLAGVLTCTAQHLFWVRDLWNGDRRLMFDQFSMSGTPLLAQMYMRTMAHLPLLLHPHPTKALLVCFGVGQTADAIRLHDSVERLDIVDLNPSVYLLNRHFAEQNGNVLADPRVRLFCGDGRQYLKFTPERYDFVTMEPPPPLQPGVSRLYSAEWYASLKARLEPGALVSQWMPEAQLDERAVDLIASTFVEAFPHSLVFVGAARDLILVGSDRPFDLAGLARRLQRERAASARTWGASASRRRRASWRASCASMAG